MPLSGSADAASSQSHGECLDPKPNVSCTALVTAKKRCTLSHSRDTGTMLAGFVALVVREVTSCVAAAGISPTAESRGSNAGKSKCGPRWKPPPGGGLPGRTVTMALPAIVGLLVSVAVIDWSPGVFRVTVKL